MEDNKGMSFLAVLQTIFIILKLNGAGAIAAWSWWLVLSPLWIGIVLFIALLIIFAIAS